MNYAQHTKLLAICFLFGYPKILFVKLNFSWLVSKDRDFGKFKVDQLLSYTLYRWWVIHLPLTSVKGIEKKQPFFDDSLTQWQTG